MLELDRKEILRYLGYRGKAADDAVQAAIESVLQELGRVMTPKVVTREIPIIRQQENTVQIEGISFVSKSLSRHLDQCDEAVLFAATLGAPVDLLMQRYHILDMSRAVICQACAAAAIEAFCDEQQDAIAKQAAERGLFLRPRYSPGYGDFPLTYQKPLLDLLNAQRRIGLTRTESDILTPSKSVTAIIGLTAEPTSCHIARCMTCNAKQCPFRKD